MTRTVAPTCPNCRSPLSMEIFRLAGSGLCGDCGRRQEVHWFPAVYREMEEERRASSLAMPEDATCFYFPHKKADYVCALSGRFISKEAATEWEGQMVAVEALLHLRNQESEVKLRTKAKLWEDIALAGVVWGLLLGPFTVFTSFVLGPLVTLVVVAMKVRQGSESVVHPGSRAKFIMAGLLALLMLGGGGWLAVKVIREMV